MYTLFTNNPKQKNNSRFASYCPYCQIASSASANPLPQGLRAPPSYDVATSTPATTTSTTTTKPPYTEAAPPPPPYTSSSSSPPTTPNQEVLKEGVQKAPPPPDTLHFVHPADDTVQALSIRYNVPADVLRRHNRLSSDHLLSARRTVLIPGSHYPSGVSLRPRPAAGEEEEARRAKVRRWMVACRCADYAAAEAYLGQTGYDLDSAVGRFLDDERWEREHPLLEAGKGKGKGKGKGVGGKGTTTATGGTWAARAAFLRRRGPS
ncbi:hypothetical protein VSDG_09058 [Cytospora chrysosperma]|uniref:LysM domain-containing protein n=1 Tax=Cytospora chrysosperma TaxID=252740 RepID=A0A423VBF8_CYTCH|nr:hypothetical protein VSDG_09058 [Valsa sordida]